MLKKNANGFTLIELLVVIAIIGSLATLILVSLTDVRGKARNARRESDVRQIILAMELDYAEDEEYSRYTVGEWDTIGQIPKDSGRYLDPVPRDSLSKASYHWRDNSVGAVTNCDSQHYCVYADLEMGGYFAGSEKGTRHLAAPPGSGADCCW